MHLYGFLIKFIKFRVCCSRIMVKRPNHFMLLLSAMLLFFALVHDHFWCWAICVRQTSCCLLIGKSKAYKYNNAPPRCKARYQSRFSDYSQTGGAGWFLSKKLSWKIRILGSHIGDVVYGRSLGAKYASFGALSITSWLIGDYNDNVFFLDRRNPVFSGKTYAFGWRKHRF